MKFRRCSITYTISIVDQHALHKTQFDASMMIYDMEMFQKFRQVTYLNKLASPAFAGRSSSIANAENLKSNGSTTFPANNPQQLLNEAKMKRLNEKVVELIDEVANNNMDKVRKILASGDIDLD